MWFYLKRCAFFRTLRTYRSHASKQQSLMNQCKQMRNHKKYSAQRMLWVTIMGPLISYEYRFCLFFIYSKWSDCCGLSVCEFSPNRLQDNKSPIWGSFYRQRRCRGPCCGETQAACNNIAIHESCVTIWKSGIGEPRTVEELKSSPTRWWMSSQTVTEAPTRGDHL